jgi:hypothetical protein
MLTETLPRHFFPVECNNFAADWHGRVERAGQAPPEQMRAQAERQCDRCGMT